MTDNYQSRNYFRDSSTNSPRPYDSPAKATYFRIVGLLRVEEGLLVHRRTLSWDDEVGDFIGSDHCYESKNYQ